MNPRLVNCLLAANLVGLLVAAGAIWAGLHPLAAIPLYSFAGSFALVAITLAVCPGEAPRRAARSAEPLVAPERAPA